MCSAAISPNQTCADPLWALASYKKNEYISWMNNLDLKNMNNCFEWIFCFFNKRIFVFNDILDFYKMDNFLNKPYLTLFTPKWLKLISNHSGIISDSFPKKSSCYFGFCPNEGGGSALPKFCIHFSQIECLSALDLSYNYICSSWTL